MQRGMKVCTKLVKCYGRSNAFLLAKGGLHYKVFVAGVPITVPSVIYKKHVSQDRLSIFFLLTLKAGFLTVSFLFHANQKSIFDLRLFVPPPSFTRDCKNCAGSVFTNQFPLALMDFPTCSLSSSSSRIFTKSGVTSHFAAMLHLISGLLGFTKDAGLTPQTDPTNHGSKPRCFPPGELNQGTTLEGQSGNVLPWA